MTYMLLEQSYSFWNGNGVFTNTVFLEAVATALNMIFVDRTFHLPVFGVPRCHLKGISRLVYIKRCLLVVLLQVKCEGPFDDSGNDIFWTDVLSSQDLGSVKGEFLKFSIRTCAGFICCPDWYTFAFQHNLHWHGIHFLHVLVPLYSIKKGKRHRSRKICLFAQNWGKIFQRCKTGHRIQKVIWDHLLAFKGEIIQKQAWFSLPFPTPNNSRVVLI